MVFSKLLITTTVPLVSSIIYCLYIGYQRRSKINAYRKQGIPMPDGWSWWTGHLMVLDRYLKRLPADANVYMAMQELVLDHADTEIFLMDFWPMADPVLMISDPETSQQVSNKYNMPKPESQHKSMMPIIGGPSLISMNDREWKIWRALFNPGFSAAHMTELVPAIVDSVEVFCDELRKRVGKGFFSLDQLSTRLTMDIIIKVTLDTDLNNQREEHRLSKSLNTILAWHSFWDPRIILNPLRPFVQWYHGRIMDAFLQKELEKRFQEMKQLKLVAKDDRSKRAKSVIALALDDYISQNSKEGKDLSETATLDEHFARIAAGQIRLFIFAGNDSTSSSIVYTFHMLFKHPEVLAKLQEEHNQVFGSPNGAGKMLKENPALMNKCPYTLAIIKETLRLFPPASSLREGSKSVSLSDRHGNVYPTEHIGATTMHRFVHTNPRVWARANDFLPERWLVEPGHELYPPQNTGAYRPFEQGPRNCIGQTLVYNEMRIILILTARTFVVKPAYDEWDAEQKRNEGWMSKMMKGLGLKGEEVKTVQGERAYQTTKAGAHPADGYPCRVTLVR